MKFSSDCSGSFSSLVISMLCCSNPSDGKFSMRGVAFSAKSDS